MTPLLVIFDCDGVIVDSEPVANSQLASFLNDRGYAVSSEDCHDRFVGRPLIEIITEARAAGACIEEDWRDLFYAQMDQAMAAGVPLIHGVVEILDALEAAGFSSAIVSNGRIDKMRLTLGPHGLFERFQGRMYSPQYHGAPKPSPEMFLLAARDAGIAPQNCLVIDDSPSGIQGAINAGMACIGYAEQTPPAKLEALGVPCVPSMSALKSTLGL